MSRQREKGTRFETQVADYMRSMLCDERIERRAKSGAKDRGDIAGVMLHGKRVVVECKNKQRMELSQWLDEAEIERGNDDAEFAFVVHKRRGCGEANMGRTYVTCDLETLCVVIAGCRALLGGKSRFYDELSRLVSTGMSPREALAELGIDLNG